MTKRKINIFDKIGSKIPGFKSYSINDEKRNSEKKLRENIASIILQAEALIINHQKKLIKENDISKAQDWESYRKILNT